MKGTLGTANSACEERVKKLLTRLVMGYYVRN